MGKSYTKINYSIRIAKAIERKIFLNFFQRLSSFGKLNNYRYIGFGSTFFNDFTLYHKLLGINDMISIEKEISNTDRFNFNKPFSCIKIKFGESGEILPLLNWDKKSIIWLDYDYDLKKSVFDDISTVFANAKSGSLLIITVKAEPYTLSDKDRKKFPNKSEIQLLNDRRLEEFKNNVGNERIPPDSKSEDLKGQNLPKFYDKILSNEITSILLNSNSVLPEKEKFNFQKVLNLSYRDGAQMYTFGGVIYKNKDYNKFKKADFQSLDFYSDNQVLKIDVPVLTLKEVKYLDTLLPNQINIETGAFKYRKKNIANIPSRDIIKYSKIYRYFPTFAEAIV